MSVIIEDLKFEDIDKVYALTKLVFKESYDIDKVKDLYNRIHNDTKTYRFLVAKIDGKVVGYTSCCMSYNLFDGDRPFMTLWWVCVDESYRRQGIATQLLGKAESIAKENNCDMICFLSEDYRVDAHQFYIKNGYHMNSKGFMKFFD